MYLKKCLRKQYVFRFCFLLLTAKIQLTNQPSPKSRQLEIGPSLPRSRTPGGLCMGRAETACTRRNVVKVIEQN